MAIKLAQNAGRLDTIANAWINIPLYKWYAALDDLAAKWNTFARIWKVLAYPSRPLSIFSKSKVELPIDRSEVNFTEPVTVKLTPNGSYDTESYQAYCSGKEMK